MDLLDRSVRLTSISHDEPKNSAKIFTAKPATEIEEEVLPASQAYEERKIARVRTCFVTYIAIWVEVAPSKDVGRCLAATEIPTAM